MQLLYEDNHLIIVNKAVGEIVQYDPSGDMPLEEQVRAYIKEKYHKPGQVYLGVVHRIDRPVSGVVLFARTGKALTRLNRMMQDRQIEKIYWAVVKDLPPDAQGTLTHYILRDTRNNRSYCYDTPRGEAREAVMHYRLLASSDRYHLLEIRLETGRHHQIRCQLAHIGCPIKGDLKYGYPRSNPDGGISLHARCIALTHPVTGERLAVEADPPDDALWRFFTNAVKKA
ncbi:MAG: RluA family pseudouridine synthase [Bacteroidales bacterium]|nr:RluA family pseudouridine synthase [Bacteroidales bacterium]MBQ7213479.1 RluA family pseudouridine synthase [Bacteroidales bacterium]